MGRRKNPDDELPSVLNQSIAIKLLEANGWIKERGGKHSTKMTKQGERPITLPQHSGRDYSRNLADRILKQAGLKGAEREERSNG